MNDAVPDVYPLVQSREPLRLDYALANSIFYHSQQRLVIWPCRTVLVSVSHHAPQFTLKIGNRRYDRRTVLPYPQKPAGLIQLRVTI